jgi:hypothetical protein
VGVDRILMLKLLGDTRSIDKSLTGTQKRLAEVSKWAKAFTLNLAIDGVEKLGDAIGDAWTGFREGEKAGAQLATTWANLGKDGDELAGVIDAISASTLKLGTDDTEAINAYNTALKTTGGDGKAAMQRLRIAQDLVANGSAPNLSSALGIIQQASKGSARAVDKFGLTSKTAAGRVKELGNKVKGAGAAAAAADPARVFFNEVNEALEGIVGSISKGDLEGAMKSLQGIGDALGKAWEKVGPGITGVFDKLSGGAFSDVMASLRELGDKIGPKVAGTIGAMMAAWVALQPILSQILTFIQPVVDLLGRGVAGGLAFVLDAVKGALEVVAALLKGDFSGAFTAVTDTVGKLGTDLNEFFVGLPGKLAEWAVEIATEASLLGKGIMDSIVLWATTTLGSDLASFFVGLPGKIAEWAGGIVEEASYLGKGVMDAIVLWAHTTLLTDLTGFFVGLPGKLLEWAVAIGAAALSIGQGIFHGIIDGLAGIAAAIAKPIQDGIDTVRRAWNSLDFRIPSFSLPAIDIGFPSTGNGVLDALLPRIKGGPWQVFEGTGDLIPDMAQGGIVTKRPGGMLARIGEGAHDEAVIPLDGQHGMGGNVTNVYITAGVGDPVAIGEQVVRALRAYTGRRGNSDLRVLVGR